MNTNALLEREISRRFKPVKYLRIEEDVEKDREYCGEYSRSSFALITGKEDVFYSRKRPVLSVFIRFEDLTAMKMNLKPEDYLGKIMERTTKIPACIGNDLYVNNERDFDLDKVLNTLLSSLKGERVQNPTLEFIDNSN